MSSTVTAGLAVKRRGVRANDPAPVRIIRCAIYTRKSTNEGLDGDFTTLDVQRNAGVAYVQSQGWECLPDRYDDGGFSGGNLERPDLKRRVALTEHTTMRDRLKKCGPDGGVRTTLSKRMGHLAETEKLTTFMLLATR